MLHINLKGKKCRTLLGWVNRSDIEIVQISIFCLNLAT